MIATDITIPLPESVQGNKYILAIIDFKIRCVQAIPMPIQKAEIVTNKLLENWFLFYGAPAIVLTLITKNTVSEFFWIFLKHSIL